MTVSRDWERVNQLFHEALALAPDARVAFVETRAGNAHVFQEVMSLLQTYSAAEGFLSTPPGSAQVRAVVARLQAGDELGPFRITSLIGAGGMGEVYRAWDTRLDRQVAIKVLPQVSPIDDAGRERFEAEARAISRLTHPRISTLYDVGSAPVGSTSVQYLVMELVEGETLAARLKRGPLPVDQALAIAIEIAEALAAAHAAGVIHRDVKPANIMLTRSGAKLLDFGLARLRPSLGAGHAASGAGDPATHATGLFGTLPYMAPELLRGAGADARTDLFAFGAVLYEMLAGNPAFAAGSEADLVAAILEREPAPVTTHQPLTPPPLERLIATCLAKDPDERWQTAQDLVRALRWVRDDQSRPASSVPTVRVMPWKTVGWGAVGITLLGLLIATAVRQRPGVNVSRVTFPVFAPPGTQFPRGTAEIAIAPDGSGLVFVAIAADGARQLWLRRFDAADSAPLAGTDGAHDPFWSPDARWIAFFTPGKLMKVSRTGGQPQVLCDARPYGRGTWNRGGTILFSGYGQALHRVPENGGNARPVTILDESRGETAHSFPVFLPDGQRFLYLAVKRGPQGSEELFQGSLDSTGARRVFASEANVGVAGRHLISLNKGVLVAQLYDPDRAAVTGAPIEIADRILSDSPRRSGGPFSVGAGSVIAYRSASPNSRLLWFDRAGRELDSFPGAADYHHPRLSPDEKSMLIEKTDPSTGRHTIWVLDLLRGTTSRLITDPFGAHQPAWSPNGRRIVFSSNRLGGLALFMAPSDGSGTAEPVLPGEKRFVYIADWSRDGHYLLYQIEREGKEDLEILSLGADRQRRTFAGSAAKEIQGQFSPDGAWIAYTSDESGSPEVYVRHFSDVGKKWQISTHGGVQGRWRDDGKELFYLATDGRLMAVDIKGSASSFQAGTPHPLFNTGIAGSFVDRFNQYLVTRDGQRVLVNRSAEDENSAPITVVMNWDAAPRQ
jgi:eukaryotic-like serine/threonine-protein kinase